MIFNGHGPLVQRYDGFNVSLTSSMNIVSLIVIYQNGLFLILGSGTSSARNENLRPLFNTNLPLILVGYRASEIELGTCALASTRDYW